MFLLLTIVTAFNVDLERIEAVKARRNLANEFNTCTQSKNTIYDTSTPNGYWFKEHCSQDGRTWIVSKYTSEHDCRFGTNVETEISAVNGFCQSRKIYTCSNAQTYSTKWVLSCPRDTETWTSKKEKMDDCKQYFGGRYFKSECSSDLNVYKWSVYNSEVDCRLNRNAYTSLEKDSGFCNSGMRTECGFGDYILSKPDTACKDVSFAENPRKMVTSADALQCTKQGNLYKNFFCVDGQTRVNLFTDPQCTSAVATQQLLSGVCLHTEVEDPKSSINLKEPLKYTCDSEKYVQTRCDSDAKVLETAALGDRISQKEVYSLGACFSWELPKYAPVDAGDSVYSNFQCSDGVATLRIFSNKECSKYKYDGFKAIAAGECHLVEAFGRKGLMKASCSSAEVTIEPCVAKANGKQINPNTLTVNNGKIVAPSGEEVTIQDAKAARDEAVEEEKQWIPGVSNDDVKHYATYAAILVGASCLMSLACKLYGKCLNKCCDEQPKQTSL